MSHTLGRVFIVGIGGAGMSGLARLLHAQGAKVCGSDAKDSRRLQTLQAEGITVFVGHNANHLVDESGNKLFDTIAASTAVPSSNPELQKAKELGIKILNRAELLCALTDDYVVASVAGTHGKTTTTSMLTLALQSSALDPSFAIGSELNESGSNAHLGSGEIFVVEADESDGTFLELNTKVAIVTNVEPDHLNYWQTFEKLEAAFIDFTNRAKSNGGVAVICVDDAGGQKLAEQAKQAGVAVRTYGQSEDADFKINLLSHLKFGWSFEITYADNRFLKIDLKVPGLHNVLNATAAAIAARELGADTESVVRGLEMFSGTRRRFEFKGSVNDIRVYDDYAHHPTEIAATLRAARDVVGDGKLVVAFQAHHYYRTALFSKEFGESLGLADVVVVLEVFAPGEEFIAGSSGQTLADNVTLDKSNVIFEPSWSKVSDHLVARSNPGDIIMTLGAGEIGLLCPEILEKLAAEK
jgi:UDP-N-acetylmuramate--alanine ligase